MPAMTGMRPAACCDGDVDQLLVLVEVDRRRLARGADDDDAVGAFGDVPVDEGLEARRCRGAPSSSIGVTMATRLPVIMASRP